MTEAGDTIIFRKRHSIITSDSDGRVADAAIKACKPENTTELVEKNGVYTFDMWIPRDDRRRVTINAVHDAEIRDQGFAWLEDI